MEIKREEKKEMEEIKISKDKTQEIQNLYQRKYAINDLCLMLASKSELVEEGNLFYNRLIDDNSACIQALDSFWNEVKNTYNITVKPDEELFLDFETGKIVLQKSTCGV